MGFVPLRDVPDIQRACWLSPAAPPKRRRAGFPSRSEAEASPGLPRRLSRCAGPVKGPRTSANRRDTRPPEGRRTTARKLTSHLSEIRCKQLHPNAQRDVPLASVGSFQTALSALLEVRKCAAACAEPLSMGFFDVKERAEQPGTIPPDRRGRPREAHNDSLVHVPWSSSPR